VSYSWAQFKETVSGCRASLTRVLKFKRQILALVVFFSIVAGMSEVAYLGHREPLVGQDDTQWEIADDTPNRSRNYDYPKAYKVVLESIDEVEGTAHLGADLKMIPRFFGSPLEYALKDYMLGDYGLKTEDVSKLRSAREQLAFGPFTITDQTPQFLDASGDLWVQSLGGYHFHPRPTLLGPEFSEVQPTTSTQKDVSLNGDSWLYPFDKYLIVAQVRCAVFVRPVTPGLKQYFWIPGDGYTLSSKLPNFLVRNATERDVESFLKSMEPDTNPKEVAKKYRPDTWRDGLILVVLERPLFPKFFASFFLILAVVGIGVIIKYSGTKKLGLNIFGYFLALWAIRAPLAAGAPKVPILMDYVTLGLYALLVAAALSKLIWGFRATSPFEKLED
jgi:hypothetical protein